MASAKFCARMHGLTHDEMVEMTYTAIKEAKELLREVEQLTMPTPMPLPTPMPWPLPARQLSWQMHRRQGRRPIIIRLVKAIATCTCVL